MADVDPIAGMLADDKWRLNVESRFWPKVMRPLDWRSCWPWIAARKSDGGYGNFRIRPRISVRAHRLSYALYHGSSPGDLFVCHHCDNPPCVNPLHLFLGTGRENMADMSAKGRGSRRDQTGERNAAAKLNGAQVEAIRLRIAAGHRNTHIASDYGVTHQMISRIRQRRAWVAGSQG